MTVLADRSTAVRDTVWFPSTSVDTVSKVRFDESPVNRALCTDVVTAESLSTGNTRDREVSQDLGSRRFVDFLAAGEPFSRAVFDAAMANLSAQFIVFINGVGHARGGRPYELP